MGFKTVLTLLVILALIGFLLTTENGREYLKSLKGIFEKKVSEVSKEEGEVKRVRFQLTLDKESVYGKTFSLSNSSFRFYGYYAGMRMGESRLEAKSEIVSISLEGVNGGFNYTSEGLKVFGTSKNIEIGDFSVSSEKGIDFFFNITPINFTVSNLKESEITFTSLTGNVSGERGFLRLSKDEVKLKDFIGSFKLENEQIIISGEISKILINGEKAII